jgi:putative SOS response-associated peptidase YedK
MCNLYATMTARAEAAKTARAMRDQNNNQPPQAGVYPDYSAPVVVNAPDGVREMRDMRWGMPTSKRVLLDAATKRADKLRAKGTEFDFGELLRVEPDKGVTNVRNTMGASGGVNKHWAPWLGPVNRCLVPFTSFSEPDQDYQRTLKAGVVRAGRGCAAGLLCRRLDATCLRAEDQDRLGGIRGVRLPDYRFRRAGEDLSPQGHAGDPDHRRGSRPLAQ